MSSKTPEDISPTLGTADKPETGTFKPARIKDFSQLSQHIQTPPVVGREVGKPKNLELEKELKRLRHLEQALIEARIDITLDEDGAIKNIAVPDEVADKDKIEEIERLKKEVEKLKTQKHTVANEKVQSGEKNTPRKPNDATLRVFYRKSKNTDDSDWMMKLPDNETLIRLPVNESLSRKEYETIEGLLRKYRGLVAKKWDKDITTLVKVKDKLLDLLESGDFTSAKIQAQKLEEELENLKQQKVTPPISSQPTLAQNQQSQAGGGNQPPIPPRSLPPSGGSSNNGEVPPTPPSGPSSTPATPDNTPKPLDVYGVWPPYIYFDNTKGGKKEWVSTLGGTKKSLSNTTEWVKADANIKPVFKDYIDFITGGNTEERQKKIKLCTELIEIKNTVIEALKKEDVSAALTLSEVLQRSIDEWKVKFPKLLELEMLQKDFSKKKEAFTLLTKDIEKYTAGFEIKETQKVELQRLTEDINHYAHEIESALTNNKKPEEISLQAFKDQYEQYETLVNQIKKEYVKERGYRGSVLRPYQLSKDKVTVTLKDGTKILQKEYEEGQRYAQEIKTQKDLNIKQETEESLRQKHETMITNNYDEYLKLYLNKKFVSGDPNEKIVQETLQKHGLIPTQPVEHYGINSTTWKQAHLDSTKYNQGIDQNYKSGIRVDETIRRANINSIIDTAKKNNTPLNETEFKNKTYIPANTALTDVSQRKPLSSATPNTIPHINQEPIVGTTPTNLHIPEMDPLGRIEPPEHPVNSTNETQTPQEGAPVPPRNEQKEAKNRAVSAVMSRLERHTAKNWRKYALPIAAAAIGLGGIGLQREMGKSAATETPTLSSPAKKTPETTPVITDSPQSIPTINTNSSSIPETSTPQNLQPGSPAKWRDYVQPLSKEDEGKLLDPQKFLQDIETQVTGNSYSGFNFTNLLAKYIPSYISPNNPETIRTILQMDGFKVFNEPGAYGLNTVQQTEIGKVLRAIETLNQTTAAEKRRNATMQGFGGVAYDNEYFAPGITVEQMLKASKQKIESADKGE